MKRRHKKRPMPPRAKRKLGPPSVLVQVRAAWHPNNRAAALVGIVLGGFVPLATFLLAHAAGVSWLAWALVVGGLLYSAPNVYAWVKAFAGSWKAAGFVLLLEGTLVASPIATLGWAALVVLAGINATATGCALAKGSRT